MEYKKKTRALPIILTVVLLLSGIVYANAQEVFAPQTPAQESMQSMPSTDKGPLLRAGGGTGSGDGINGGGGTDNNGNQNDTDVPVTDALPLILLMATTYLMVKNKKLHTHKNK